MTNQQKTILFWLGMALGVVVILFFLVTIQQKRDTAPTTNQVSFTGEGKIASKPDVAIADFSIVTSGTTSKAAQDSNSARSKKVYDFLKRQGVDDKDIKTTYNITPQYAPMRGGVQPMPLYQNNMESMPVILPAPTIPGTPGIIGYQVTQGYEVKIRNLDKASAVIDGLVTAGANQVSNVRFDFEDRDKVMAEARGKAIADAKSKARQLESQIGIRLGKIINYYDNTLGYPYAYDKMYAAGIGGGGTSIGPVLPPGENELTVSVTITYQIK